MIHPLSVLYADDEPALLDTCKLYLGQTKEFAVITASSASVALDQIKSMRIQTLVSDCQLPVMNGIGFLKQVRATVTCVPFTVFSGNRREEIAVQAFENGADFCLPKGGALKLQVAELLHRRQQSNTARLMRRSPPSIGCIRYSPRQTRQSFTFMIKRNC